MGVGEHTGRREGRLGLDRSRIVVFYGLLRALGLSPDKPCAAAQKAGLICRGSGTLDAPTIGLQVAPFSVAPTEQIAYLLAVTCQPRLTDAAPPGDQAGRDAV